LRWRTSIPQVTAQSRERISTKLPLGLI